MTVIIFITSSLGCLERRFLMQEINALGTEILGIVQHAAYWIIVVSGSIEVVKNVANHNYEKAIPC